MRSDENNNQTTYFLFPTVHKLLQRNRTKNRVSLYIKPSVHASFYGRCIQLFNNSFMGIKLYIMCDFWTNEEGLKNKG